MSNLDDLIQRYLNNTASDEDRAALMAMIQSEEFEVQIKNTISEDLRAEMLQKRLPDLESQIRSEAIYQRILATRTQSEVEKMWVERESQIEAPSTGKYLKRVWYAAASFVVLTTASVLLYTQYRQTQQPTAFIDQPSEQWIKISNSGTELQKIALNDGSIISLEPGSEVRYPEKFDAKREVYLSGEAFFEIAKDAAHPFLVYTNEVTTKVLGTSFRIKARQQSKEIVVAVTTGKVSVYAKPASAGFLSKSVQEVTLTPNLQAIYSRSDQCVVKQIVESPKVIAPQSLPKDYYTNTQVVQILSELGKSYGVEIKYDKEALANCTLVSDVMDGEGLYDQLEVICHALGGRYSIEGTAIVIEAGGCNQIDVKP
jgi:ferric-dicitrate binding protein FerR (iron transport regulator)